MSWTIQFKLKRVLSIVTPVSNAWTQKWESKITIVTVVIFVISKIAFT